MTLFLVSMLALSVASEADVAVEPAPDKVVAGYSDDPKAREIGLLLRCPVCQGMPIVDSPADMAQSMMRRIREMSAEGKTKDEILEYFTARYGDWVLLEPRKEGLNWLVWVMPPLFLLLGVLMALGYGRRSKSRTPSRGETAGSDDPYVRAIRDEVDG